MYYWTDNASRRPIMVLCTSHSTFFVSGLSAFDCSFSSSPLLLPQVSWIMLSNSILLLSCIMSANIGKIIGWMLWEKALGLTNSSRILWTLQMILKLQNCQEAWMLPSSPKFSTPCNNNNFLKIFVKITRDPTAVTKLLFSLCCSHTFFYTFATSDFSFSLDRPAQILLYSFCVCYFKGHIITSSHRSFLNY